MWTLLLTTHWSAFPFAWPKAHLESSPLPLIWETWQGLGMVELASNFFSWCFWWRDDKCDYRCQSLCEWRDHIGTRSLVLTRLSSSSSDRGSRSWCRPKLAFRGWTQSCARPSSWVILLELARKAHVSPFSRHSVERCPELLVESPRHLGLTPLKLWTLSPLPNNWYGHLPHRH